MPEVARGGRYRFFPPESFGHCTVNLFAFDFGFLPAKDIALYVYQGMVDMGITGEDIQESRADVDVV